MPDHIDGLVALSDGTLVPPDEVWRYDSGASLRIPLPRTIGSADLVVTRLRGAPGDAERLARMFGHCLRYCFERKKWLTFLDRGPCWRWDDSGGLALAMVAETMHETYRQARKIGDLGTEKAALKTLFVRQLREILTAAEEGLRVPLKALDSHPDLLACENGTIELKTGALIKSDRAHFITRAVPFGYDPGAEAPLFEAFLRRALKGDLQAFEAMRVFLGYSCTGRTSSKAVFLVCGPGDTGKSTLLRVFQSLLGDYACQIQIETLMKGAEHSNNALADLASLRGARFCMTSEVDKGHRLNVSRLKKITAGSGGLIDAVLKYENPMQFVGTHKLFIDCNYAPIVPHDDGALFNRLVCIPFETIIPASEQDGKLDEKLAAESEGVLAWAARGAAQWYRAGGVLPRPPVIALAGNVYRGSMDAVVKFEEDCCEKDPEQEVGSSVLYHAYEHFCQQQRCSVLSHKKFIQLLKERGFRIGERREGNVVEGIKLS